MDHFKQESLRLVSDLIHAAHGTVLNEDQSREDEARAALLAHIQRGVPEGNERDEWEAVVFTLMGHAASLYFLGQSDMPNWFYELAEKLAHSVDEALAARVREVGIQQRAALAAAPDQFRDATKMIAEPAEVPMPEPDASLHDDGHYLSRAALRTSDYYHQAGLRLEVVSVEKARTYGERCRAAGEAAGYARGVDACVAALVALKPESGVNADGSTWLVRISRQDCVEACAALRGEVK